MTVRTILTVKGQEVVTADVDQRVEDIVSLLAERRIGAVPVMENGGVAGIFSERDLLYAIAKQGPVALTRKVREVMTAPAITIDANTGADEAMALMTRRRIRHLPVVEGQALIGFVSIGDLVKDRIDAIVGEAQAMRDYIQTA